MKKYVRKSVVTVLISLMFIGIFTVKNAVTVAADSPFLARVDDTEFDDFEKALKAWKNGTTLTLLGNINYSDKIVVDSSKTLDLNGMYINGKSGNNTMAVLSVESGNTLTLKDSAGNGKITGGTNGIYVEGTLDMYGGTISDNSTNGVYVDSGTFNFHGGTLENNTECGVKAISGKTVIDGENAVIKNNTKSGVEAWASANVTLNNGEISGNGEQGMKLLSSANANINGGTISGNQENGIYVFDTTGTVNMNGGSIINNTNAQIASDGSDARVRFTMNDGEINGTTGFNIPKNVDITINGGTVKGSNHSFVTGTGSFLTIGKEGESSEVYIGGAVETSDTAITLNDGFFDEAAKNSLEGKTDKKFVPSGDGTYAIGDNGTHRHDAINFQAWTNTGRLPDKAGSYYLASDVALNEAWDVPKGKTDLCLNGHSITGISSNDTITVKSGSSLNLYDDENKGSVRHGTQCPHYGISVDGGTLNMYGGKIKENGRVDATDGYSHQEGAAGGVYVGNNGSFNLYGGFIMENHYNGVMVEASVFTMDRAGSGAVPSISSNKRYAIHLLNGSEYSVSTAAIRSGIIDGNGVGSVFLGTNNSYANTKLEISGGYINGAVNSNWTSIKNAEFVFRGGYYTEQTKNDLQEVLTEDQAFVKAEPTEGLEKFKYTIGSKAEGGYHNITVLNTFDETGNPVGGNVRSEVTMAKAGETVRLHVGPERGFAVGEVHAVDTSGKKVDVKKDDEGFFFKMPDEDVTVSAEFYTRHDHDDLSFKAWDKADSLPDKEGNYYLTKDVKLNDSWKVEGKVNLCLNGKKITSAEVFENNNLISIQNGAVLTIYDDEASEGIITSSSDKIISIDSSVTGAVLNMYGGAIVSGDTSDQIGVYIPYKGSFNLYSGKICIKGISIQTDPSDSTVTIGKNDKERSKDIFVQGTIHISSKDGELHLYDGYYDQAAYVSVNNKTEYFAEGEGLIKSDEYEGYSYTVGQLFKINILETENGTVEANYTQADKNTEIKLTVTPDEGCDVISTTVTDEEGNDIPLSDGKFVMPASDVTVNVVIKKRVFTVTFFDEDKETVLQTLQIEYGEMPKPKEPVKGADAQYSYQFAGWEPELIAAKENAEYTAKYTSEVNKYTITWKDEDGTVLKTESVEYGKMPVYDGDTPTKEDDSEITYVFAGWDPNVQSVTEDAVYTAVFTDADLITIGQYYRTSPRSGEKNGDIIPFSKSEDDYVYCQINTNEDVGRFHLSSRLDHSSTATVGYNNHYTFSLDTPTRNPGITVAEKRNRDPWGVKVVSGKGTSEDPYVFEVLLEEPKTFTVTFDTHGRGKTPEPQTVYEGNRVSKPSEDPVAEGYTFDGWYADEDLTTKWDFTNRTVTQDTTIYGKFTQQTAKPNNLHWDTAFYHNVNWTNPDDKASYDVEVTLYYAGDEKGLTGSDRSVGSNGRFSFYGLSGDKYFKEHGEGQYYFKIRIKENGKGWSEYVQSDPVNFYRLECFVSDEEGEDIYGDGGFINLVHGTQEGETRYLEPLYLYEGLNIKATAIGEVGYRFDKITVNDKKTENPTSFVINGTTKVIAVYKEDLSTIDVTLEVGEGHEQLAQDILNYILEDDDENEHSASLNGTVLTLKWIEAGSLEAEVVDYLEEAIDEVIDESYLDNEDKMFKKTFVGKKRYAEYKDAEEIEQEILNRRTAALNKELKLYALWENQVPLNVTVSDTQNGTVSADKQKAIKGDVITLTVTPAEGYELEELSVKDKDGSPLSLSEENTFVMPASDVTVSATFKKKEFIIKFKDEDGTLLQSSPFPYGDTPVYKGSVPSKDPTAEKEYTFDGWYDGDNKLTDETKVSGETVYVARYTEAARMYSITFVDEDGTVLQSSKVDYGTTPSYTKETPSKKADAQYTYAFNGWEPELTSVAGDTTYKATYSSTVNTYKITFVDEDGTKELFSNTFEYGAMPVYGGETPTKKDDGEKKYTFSGWTPAISSVKEEIVYTATFVESSKTYNVIWLNNDEKTTLHKKEENITMARINEVLAEIETPVPAVKDDLHYDYTFLNWNTREVGDLTQYIATFSQRPKIFRITWKNGETVLKEETAAYRATPVYSGPVPTKAEDDRNTYTFDGWGRGNPHPTNKDTTYVARFVSTPRKYKIRFVDGDGYILRTDEVEYGATPVYSGTTPTKSPSKQYVYEFKGWDPEITAVTGDATYKASFEENARKYTVTFVNDDGSHLQSLELGYGETPVYSGKDPVKKETAGYTYVFNGWKPEITQVSDNARYTATYTKVPKKFKVTFDSNGGNKVAAVEVDYDSPITAPSDPSKEGSIFAGWYLSDDTKWDFSTPIKGEVTLIAQYYEESVPSNINGKDVMVAKNDLEGKTVNNRYNDKPLVIFTNNGVIIIPANLKEDVRVPEVSNKDNVVTFNGDITKGLNMNITDHMYGIYLEVTYPRTIVNNLKNEDQRQDYTEVANSGFTAEFFEIYSDRGHRRHYDYPGTVSLNIELGEMGITLPEPDAGMSRTFYAGHNYKGTSVEYLQMGLSSDGKTANISVSTLSPFDIVYRDVKKVSPSTPSYVAPKTGIE